MINEGKVLQDERAGKVAGYISQFILR